MGYTTSEVSKKLGITKDSLRYYEKEGLLPPVERDSSGHRIYSDSDVEWIFLIKCLRDTVADIGFRALMWKASVIAGTYNKLLVLFSKIIPSFITCFMTTRMLKS